MAKQASRLFRSGVLAPFLGNIRSPFFGLGHGCSVKIHASRLFCGPASRQSQGGIAQFESNFINIINRLCILLWHVYLSFIQAGYIKPASSAISNQCRIPNSLISSWKFSWSVATNLSSSDRR